MSHVIGSTANKRWPWCSWSTSSMLLAHLVTNMCTEWLLIILSNQIWLHWERSCSPDTDSDQDINRCLSDLNIKTLTKLTILRVFYQFIPNFLYVFVILQVWHVGRVWHVFVVWTVQGPISFFTAYIQQISVRFLPDALFNGTH